jgi:catechol-2,3-dioxygenase
VQLNHVHLKSKDPDKLCEFYKKYFNLNILARNDVEIYIGTHKGTWLTISQSSKDDLPLPPWFHFGFCVSSKEEVRNLFEKMKQDALKFPRELTEFGEEGLTYYVLDSDDNKIEVSWIKDQQG